MRVTIRATFVLAAVAATTIPSAAPAQKPDTTTIGRPSTAGGGPGFSGAFDLGIRDSYRQPAAIDLGKLDQYRDLSSCAFRATATVCPTVDAFRFGWSPADSFRTVQLVGHNVGKLDQSLWLRGTEPGLFDAQLRWDRIPHTFSTNGRSLGSETAPGVYVLPIPRPDTATWNRAGYLGPIRTIWDPVKLSLGLTPSSNWDFKTEYTHTDKNGSRPMGMAMGGSGTNARAILEPIDQTVHDVKVSQSYADSRFQVVAMYNLSVFHNAIESVTSDNPLLAAPTATTGSDRGRTALAPSNLAHTVTGTGALNLAFHTRVSGSAMLGWWRQDAPFIPATINTALVDPRVATIPAAIGTGLNANVRTSMMNLSATSRPMQALTVSARYRAYDYHDDTPMIHVPVLVISDRSYQNADSAERRPYSTNEADASMTWRVLEPLALSAGYAWNRMNRDSTVREVARVTETTPRASLDFTGIDWLTLRASYSKGWRRGSSYNQTETTENPDFRRFDEADRNRERVVLMAQVTPIDQIGIALNWEIGHDEYLNSLFGVQSDRSSSVGTDIDWAPSQRLSIGAGFTRDVYLDRMRDLYRTGSTPATLANPTFVWIGNNQDRSYVASANFMAVLVPDAWEIGGTLEVSQSRFVMLANNPLTPTGGTAAQNIQATAANFPEITQKLQPLTLFLRHGLTSNWSMTLRYQGELYNQNDFRTLNLAPATGNYIFLGDNYNNYDARFITLSMTYRPGLLRLGRSTL